MTKTIDLQIGNGGTQKAFYSRTFTTGAHTLRVTIHADDYQAQSTAKIELWNGTEWKHVTGLHSSKITTKPGYGHGPGSLPASHFAADESRMMEVALAIVEGAKS